MELDLAAKHVGYMQDSNHRILCNIYDYVYRLPIHHHHYEKSPVTLLACIFGEIQAAWWQDLHPTLSGLIIVRPFVGESFTPSAGLPAGQWIKVSVAHCGNTGRLP